MKNCFIFIFVSNNNYENDIFRDIISFKTSTYVDCSEINLSIVFQGVLCDWASVIVLESSPIFESK